MTSPLLVLTAPRVALGEVLLSLWWIFQPFGDSGADFHGVVPVSFDGGHQSFGVHSPTALAGSVVGAL